MSIIKSKYIDFNFYKKHKHSRFYILPMFILNISYENLTIVIFVFVFEFRLNRYKSKCYNCGEICKNKTDADNHCFDNLF